MVLIQDQFLETGVTAITDGQFDALDRIVQVQGRLGESGLTS